ncbi:MAG TPA: MGMT family protein [Terriglobales bacterium]|nr:MGMT family protein [Terriglobales bacterium]
MFGRIRKTIRQIPRGRVATYGQVARAAGYPGAARQVVWALHTSRGLPWHRVVGAGGRIRLPGEEGFEQRLRLENEGVTFAGSRVQMDLHQHEWKRKARPAKRRSQRGRPRRTRGQP